ncbi:MAG: membrane protein insertase YidC [Pseudanabaenaceae cyanobacterium]|jgi:YidC/Oxa1 family membrane protein insertase
MDFGVGFLSNNIMLPFLDFFYGLVPNYGWAIIALTLLVRFALFPVSANQLRNMRRMKIANPIMQQRMKDVQERHKGDPVKLQEEMQRVQSENFKEFGNPLSGCLPALLQLPILFALFATLRGSPFADIKYDLNFQFVGADQGVQHQVFNSAAQNVYFADRVHYPVLASVSEGTTLAVGETAKINFQTANGESFDALRSSYPDTELTPRWTVVKGKELVEVGEDGTLRALQPGDVSIQAFIPGLAASKGFLFIQALGKSGATNPDGSINWDVVLMVLGFGLSLYINQNISGNSPTPAGKDENNQQDTVNKLTPIIFSGMFLFFPLPSGVMLYMLIANVFQTAQAFLVAKEPLPENLQKLVEAPATAKAGGTATKSSPAKSSGKMTTINVKAQDASKDALPFEPNSKKKKKGGNDNA